MTAFHAHRRLILCVLGAAVFHCAAGACPSCYGAADGPVIEATGTAVLVMMGITGSVLSFFAGFFITLARRARRNDRLPLHDETPETSAQA